MNPNSKNPTASTRPPVGKLLAQIDSNMMNVGKSDQDILSPFNLKYSGMSQRKNLQS